MTEFQYIAKPEDKDVAIKDIIRRNFTFSSRLRTKLKQQNLVYLNGKPTPGWVPALPGDIN